MHSLAEVEITELVSPNGLMIAIAFILFFVFALVLIWFWIQKQDSPGELNIASKLTSLLNPTSATFGTTGMRTRIVFNGKEYSSLEEMPAEIRREYERAMATVLADTDRDGIPDIFEGGNSATLFHTDVLARTSEDPAEKLKKLKEMMDAGLITEQEYETKKTEILNRM